MANLISDMSISDRRAVGCEKKTLETLNKMSPVSEYRRMKAEASKVRLVHTYIQYIQFTTVIPKGRVRGVLQTPTFRYRSRICL